MNRNSVYITTLVENSVNVAGLKAEHGLAFLIRGPGVRLLFDAGQSDLLAGNARKMGLHLRQIDGIALSHGHYDHTGGIEAVLAESPRARFFLHPAAPRAKYTLNADGTSRSAGMPPGSVAALERLSPLVTWTTNPTELAEGIFLTGQIPRHRDFEDTGGRFFLDDAGRRPDPLEDDQALFFGTARGTIVVLGCGHAGVVNTLDYVSQLTRGRPILAVIGGMHLLSAGPDRMRKTMEALARFDISRFIPAHCTGMNAIGRLWAAYPERCSLCPVGTTLEFPLG